MILVIGATGFLGGEVCNILAAEGNAVRAMVRPTSDKLKTARLEQKDIELCVGDLRDPSSFPSALEGVETVIATASAMPFSYVAGENNVETVDQLGLIKLIDSAHRSGVKHFIYTSFSGNIDENFPLRNAKRATEQHLISSGMEYTILRPGYFMEAWMSSMVGFDIENGKVQLCGDGMNPVSYISLKDVAAFAVKSVENQHARNRTLELGGPDAISQLEAVKIFEECTGQHIEVSNVPSDALRSNMNQATDPMEQSFAGLMLCLSKGDAIDMSQMTDIFRINLTSVRNFASEILKSAIH